MSQKTLDDLKTEIPLYAPKVADRISAFVLVLADRVAALGGNAVKASDLATTLRLDPDSLGVMIATNPAEVELAPATTNPPAQGMKDPDPVNTVTVKGSVDDGAAPVKTVADQGSTSNDAPKPNGSTAGAKA